MRNVLLRLSLDPRIHQTINIMIVDIPETYGMWLSRDCPEKLKAYLATNWSHLLLPFNGKPNKLKIIIFILLPDQTIQNREARALLPFYLPSKYLT